MMAECETKKFDRVIEMSVSSSRTLELIQYLADMDAKLAMERQEAAECGTYGGSEEYEGEKRFDTLGSLGSHGSIESLSPSRLPAEQVDAALASQAASFLFLEKKAEYFAEILAAPAGGSLPTAESASCDDLDDSQGRNERCVSARIEKDQNVENFREAGSAQPIVEVQKQSIVFSTHGLFTPTLRARIDDFDRVCLLLDACRVSGRISIEEFHNQIWTLEAWMRREIRCLRSKLKQHFT